jgi:peptide/nickel transport system substrate-binding protein
MRRLIAALLLVVLATQTGPVAAQTKVLRVVPHADLTQLDPVFAAILITREYGLMVYEELFAWDAKLQPRPQMSRAGPPRRMASFGASPCAMA